MDKKKSLFYIKLNKAILQLAKCKSKREVCPKLHMDRDLVSKVLGGSKLVPYKFAYKVVSDVLKNKLTFFDIKKKYGIRGLRAVNHWKIIKEKYKFNQEVKLIAKLRLQKDKLKMPSLEDLGIKLNLSRWAIRHRLQRYLKTSKVEKVNCIRGEYIRNLVLSLWNSGIRDVNFISHIVNRTAQHIRTILRNNGIFLSNNFKDNNIDIKLIDRLKNVISLDEIASIFGKPKGYIYNLYREKFDLKKKCLKNLGG